MNQENTPPFHVLIAAAGKGSRLNDALPKQYINIHGKTLIQRTVEAFVGCEGLQSIRVIIDPQDAKLYHHAFNDIDTPEYIAGSKTRKDSVYNGLKSLKDLRPEDIILIHDAARPFITHGQIQNVAIAAKNNRAATLATTISDTIREPESGQDIDRSALRALQTPQGFHYQTIIDAHEKSSKTKCYTDDTSIVIDAGQKVHYVEGHKTNFKITTQDDLAMAKTIIASEYNDIRTGLGYDVHAFDTASSGPIRICGIDIEHDHKLKGHSDADVALHTITDALLGAIGEGDIGQHFPPSDNTFKDMDSAIFLEKAAQILNHHNAIIKNIDITIICETPKIGPHAPKMRQRVADILKIEPSRVNIKATTSERLGFTGRKEGIAAQAAATIAVKG